MADFSKGIEVYFSSKKGERDENEDNEAIVVNMSGKGRATNKELAPINLFIICDGHGGGSVSKVIVPYLKRKLMDKSMSYPLKHNTIITIFDKIQGALIEHPNQIAYGCGSTALIMIMYYKNNGFWCQVINLGDCRAIMAKNGFGIPLTKDHKPHLHEEKLRINKVNKTSDEIHLIKYDEGDYRIRGLSVSRALGDIDLTPHVTHIPDSFIYELDCNTQFIALACDGVWDVLRNEEVVNFVNDHRMILKNKLSKKECNSLIHTYSFRITEPDGRIREYPIKHSIEVAEKEKNNIACKLADYAIANNSGDNITAVIIFPEIN